MQDPLDRNGKIATPASTKSELLSKESNRTGYPGNRRGMDRRAFLKAVGITGAALIGSPLLTSMSRVRAANRSGYVQPNILVIVVDQLRAPQWFPEQSVLDEYLPNMAALRQASVSFNNYHTAGVACTAARGTLLTGLYAQQTFLMATQTNNMAPSLNKGFPTWGNMLQDFGYQTWWFGKWHLSHADTLKPYGFEGGTFPSPNGAPGEGYRDDPYIVAGGTPPKHSHLEKTPQFAQWLASNSGKEPWCTTVSLINPHDIKSYFNGTIDQKEYRKPPQVFTSGIPNFETTGMLTADKPGLQIDFQNRINEVNGTLPSDSLDDANHPLWLDLLNTYLVAQTYVDTQIGIVLTMLSDAGFASNTMVIFASDHGEHGGAHGLRNKGGSAYRESLKVPLYVSDPTGQWGATPNTTRDQFCSSVDIAPLLLTLATGDGSWRRQKTYSPLKGRYDIAATLGDASAPGRPYILHTTDEIGLDESAYSPPSPTTAYHVIGYVTPDYKLCAYSNWNPGTVDLNTTGQELEVYDYTNANGILEVDNVATTEPELTATLYDSLFDYAAPGELRQPLPGSYADAQQEAATDYLTFVANYTAQT
jgi:arylsulfatase A-like enzyme